MLVFEGGTLQHAPRNSLDLKLPTTGPVAWLNYSPSVRSQQPASPIHSFYPSSTSIGVHPFYRVDHALLLNSLTSLSPAQNGYTVLFNACQSGQYGKPHDLRQQTVTVLINKGANVNSYTEVMGCMGRRIEQRKA